MKNNKRAIAWGTIIVASVLFWAFLAADVSVIRQEQFDSWKYKIGTETMMSARFNKKWKSSEGFVSDAK